MTRHRLRGAAVLTAAVLAASFGAPVAVAQESPSKLTRVASFDHQVTGVTVTEDGRIFVNFPRWTEDTPISVAELKNGVLRPYPDAEWNSWRNARKDEISAKNHWVCVQSVVADRHGSLWVIDPAAPAMAAVVADGPKLVRIDLRTDRVTKTIAFDETVAPQGSYLNDVRLSPDGRTAYLTDSGARGSLVVVDIASGKARRVLDGRISTMPDKSVTVTIDGQPLRRPDGRGVDFAADGLALSRDGKTVYWQAIKGKTLYSLPSDLLRATGRLQDPDAKVTPVGTNGPADGLMISPHDGLMYVSSPQDNAIKTRDLTKADAPLKTVVRDERLHWPDTFSEGPEGTIYFTTSHIQDSAFYKADAPAALPTELWSLSR